MMHKTHLAFSFLCSMLLMPAFPIPGWLFVLIFLVAALIPDIDTTSSFLGKRFKIIGWIFGHRGIFHSVFPLLALSILIYMVLGIYYALAFALGYLSHLLLDMLNHQGVGLLFPLSRKRIRGFSRTGGLFEKIFFACCLVGIAIVLLRI